MRLTLLVYEFLIPGCQSIKDKRRVVKGLKDSLRNRFNVSVAEVDHQDKWQRSTVALALVTESSQNLESVLSEIDNLVSERLNANIIKNERFDFTPFQG